MKRGKLLHFIAGLAIAATCSLSAQAQLLHPAGGTPYIKGGVESTDGNFNFKTFEVEAVESGSYFAEFWLQPSRYANNLYTTFGVYVNDNYVGSITPSIGNWQAIRLDDNQTLELNKGTNYITVATAVPETPNVETLKIALTDSEAIISSEAYDEYMNKAYAGTKYYIPEEEMALVSPASTFTNKHFNNVPLNYTFYKTFSFIQGQEIFITSSSAAEHNLDVVYYGEAVIFEIQDPRQPRDSIPPPPTGQTNSDEQIRHSFGPTNPIIFPWNPKIPYFYIPATSEEMQGLNWRSPSQRTINSTADVAVVRMTVPRTGMYLVRLRTVENGGSAIADLNVNGEYFYEEVPISLSRQDWVIPADGNKYETLTCCNTFGVDDPFLFVHGADADRIVGFNDDGPRYKQLQFDLSGLDSYLLQQYFIDTSAISVSNYSSLQPSSKCSIYIYRYDETETSSRNIVRAKMPVASHISAAALTKDNDVNIPSNIERGADLTISATGLINNVSVYTLYGVVLSSVNVGDVVLSTSTSTLNISQPGVYIIRVETTKGETSRKVIVK